MTQKNAALYMHWPFCAAKCPYCDFNAHVRDHIDFAAWQQNLCRELDYIAAQTNYQSITSIFFGGGTPSLMPPELVAGILDHIAKLWSVAADIEITLEANPTSVEAARFSGYRAAGVNRVSLGVQALNDRDLKALGRQHSFDQAMSALKTAQKTFDRYSFDLIYARPDQSLADWQTELTRALDFAGGHLSLYQLTIEPGTYFHTLHQRGDLILPDEDVAADMYQATDEILAAQNYRAYEISNYAVSGAESQHNLTYWRYGDYIGIGPGAHGRVTIAAQKSATKTHRAPEIWLDWVQQKGHGYKEFEPLEPAIQIREALLMGFRITEGIDLAEFENIFAVQRQDVLDWQQIDLYCAQNHMTKTGDTLALSASGRLLADRIITDIIR